MRSKKLKSIERINYNFLQQFLEGFSSHFSNFKEPRALKNRLEKGESERKFKLLFMKQRKKCNRQFPFVLTNITRGCLF